MDEIINLNGVEYIQRSKVAEIEQMLNQKEEELEKIKEVISSSFKDLIPLVKTDLIDVSDETRFSKVEKTNRKYGKTDELFSINESSKILYKIKEMDSEGNFYSSSNRKLVINIKHVLEVQKALYSKITNGEVRALGKKIGLNHYNLHRLIYNYQEHTFDKYISQWIKQSQPKIGITNRPIENNPEKRKDSVIYG